MIHGSSLDNAWSGHRPTPLVYSHHQFEGRLPFAALTTGARPVTPSHIWDSRIREFLNRCCCLNRSNIAAVAITRVDFAAGELRKAARKEKTGTVARRILALALVLEGLD